MKRIIITLILIVVCFGIASAANAPTRLEELRDQLNQVVLAINNCDAVIAQKEQEKKNLEAQGYMVQGAIQEIERQQAEEAKKKETPKDK